MPALARQSLCLPLLWGLSVVEAKCEAARLLYRVFLLTVFSLFSLCLHDDSDIRLRLSGLCFSPVLKPFPLHPCRQSVPTITSLSLTFPGAFGPCPTDAGSCDAGFRSLTVSEGRWPHWFTSLSPSGLLRSSGAYSEAAAWMPFLPSRPTPRSEGSCVRCPCGGGVADARAGAGSGPPSGGESADRVLH